MGVATIYGEGEFVYVRGSVRGHFSTLGNMGDYGEDGLFLAFSEGTVIKAIHEQDGSWVLSVAYDGAAKAVEAPKGRAIDTGIYSDVISLCGAEIKWCVAGQYTLGDL